MKNKKILAPILMGCGLSACNPYTSSYITTMCVITNTNKEASMVFESFEGTRVLQLKPSNGVEEVELRYAASIKSGKMTIYYDSTGEKKELVTLNDSSPVNDIITIKYSNPKIYLIFESPSCSNGVFDFSFVELA